MLYRCQAYTIGRYEETSGGSLSFNGPALLASTLAWAAKNQIPFHQAVLSLSDYGIPFECGQVIFFPRKKNWNQCLLAAHYDLVSGVSLSRTLRRRLSYFLPEFFLQGVEKAERDGRLPEVLPGFARRLNLASDIQLVYQVELWVPALLMLLTLTIFSFLGVFIAPKMLHLFRDLYENLEFSHLIALNYICTWGSHIGVIILFALIAIITGYLLNRWCGSFIMRLFGELLIWVPFCRRQQIDMAMLELSASMASYLASGEDVLNAAKFSRQACRQFWLRRKLSGFIRRMEKGQDWLESWRQMKLSLPLSDLMISNAAARGDIVGGFDTLAEWFYLIVMRTVKRNLLWISLASVAINASLIFLIAWAFFGSLVKIITLMAGS